MLKDRSLVTLPDTSWYGIVPLVLGADLPEGYEDVQIRCVGINSRPLCWAAPERPPWGSGLPYNLSIFLCQTVVPGALAMLSPTLSQWFSVAVYSTRPILAAGLSTLGWVFNSRMILEHLRLSRQRNKTR